VPAVGFRLQHRHGGDAAADRARHPHRDRQALAGEGLHRQRGPLRPHPATGGRRPHADARLRGQRRRPAHARRQPAQPDRPRLDRAAHR
jgi:hypothetical protein